MLTQARLCLLALVLASATACGGPRESRAAAGVSNTPGPNQTAGMRLSGRALQEYGGSLLAFLYGRVSGMEIDYSSIPCPSIQIRGRKSLVGSTDPLVYVDGARAVNSCVLEMLFTRDVRSVEVYPMGVSNRPGYQTHPNGLILVFVHDGPLRDLPDGNENRRVVLSGAE